MQLHVVLDGNSQQDCPVNAKTPQGTSPGHTLFLLCLDDLYVVCNIKTYTYDAIIYLKFDLLSDIW